MRLLFLLFGVLSFSAVVAQDTVLAFSGNPDTKRTHLIAVDMVTGMKKNICEVQDYNSIYRDCSTYDPVNNKMYFIGDNGSISARQYIEVDVATGSVNNKMPLAAAGTVFHDYKFHQGYKKIFAIGSLAYKTHSICWLDYGTHQWNEIIKIPGEPANSKAVIDHKRNAYIYISVDYSGVYTCRTIDIAQRKITHAVTFKHPHHKFGTYDVNDFLYDENTQTGYITHMRGGDSIEIISLDVLSGNTQQILSIPANYTYFTGSSAYNSNTGKFYFSTKVAADTRLFTFDVRTKKLQESKLDNTIWNYVTVGDLYLYNTSPALVAQSYKPLFTSFKTYPNPSNGIVNIDGISGNSEVIIYNNKGTEIMRYKENPMQVNFDGLPAGQYFIRIVDDGKAQTQSVIINH